MIYKYSEILKKYNNDKEIKKALLEKRLYKTNLGLYTDKKDISKLEEVSKKFENYIFNSDSAFFYHGLTDNIPEKYYLSTKKKSRKIKNNDIKQTFMEDKYFYIGDSYIYYNNIKIRIYDKERMLIELIRNKNNISYDMYKEIIKSYRNIIDSLNLLKLQEYTSKFSNGKNILKTIQEEVL